MKCSVDAARGQGQRRGPILSMIEERDRHGYEIARLIEGRSGGVLCFNIASFYPLLYQLEKRGLIKGR